MSLRKLVGIALTISACEGVIPEDMTQVPPAPTELDAGVVEPETGELLYKQRCASCHGASGEGSELAYQIRSPVRAYAKWVVRNGRDEHTYAAGMTRISEASLSDAQLEKIFDFLHAVPMPTSGLELYTRFCSNCHGAAGSGGRSDEALLKTARKEPEEIDEAIRKGHGRTKFGDAEEYMPSWRADELTPTQVRAITDYLVDEARRAPDEEEDDDDDDDDEEDDDEG